MIDLKALEKSFENQEGTYYQDYKNTLKNRNASVEDIDKLLALNSNRKKLITEAEQKKAEQNKITQEIAVLKKNKQDATSLMEKVKSYSDDIKSLSAQSEKADKEVMDLLAVLPNKIHSSVPVGKSEQQNRVEKTVGEPKKFSFTAKDHADIGEKLGIINFERAVKISGARFSTLKGQGARLERALIQFMLDMHTKKHGYTELSVPFMVNSNSLFGTGNFPKFKEDVFKLEGFDYYLIPTAEVPVTNYYGNEVLKESDLPQAFVAYSPCFRSEAGSYGKDTKGIIRQHQFHKVEIVRFAHPDKSYEEHEKLVSHAEEILNQLELPYRRVTLCSGDISFGAAKCYDLEVWLPAQNAYREISSCSNFEDFQARRANIRFKPNDGGKPQFVHTLNGSGLAVGRTLVAILENYQRENGTVDVPEALRPYMGVETITGDA
jgi:seryl-tRNA synthetase